MVYTDMEEINDITMDITKIKYKTFRNMSDVNIIVNNILYPIQSIIKSVVATPDGFKTTILYAVGNKLCAVRDTAVLLSISNLS